MIIRLTINTTALQRQAINDLVCQSGYTIKEVTTRQGVYLVAIGSGDIDIRSVGALPGVSDVYRVPDGYKLVSRKWKAGTNVVRLGEDVTIGGDEPAIIAGPCSIENEDQVMAVAGHLKKNGVRIMRGGVFKPRSSPYAFQGSGLDGLKMFSKICREQGLYLITEVMEISQIEPMLEYVDIFQVGARNTQNFNLLRALGACGRPVLLKRGISGTIDELLQSAEYIFSSGNEEIILCERGIRSFENAYRNTFDINAIPVLKQKTHLPVIADPSHGIGIREHVPAVALAAIAAGADGIIYEVHPQPEEAFSDGQQTLNFEESGQLCANVNKLINRLPY